MPAEPPPEPVDEMACACCKGMSVTTKPPNFPPASLMPSKFPVSTADFRSANLISGTAEGEEGSSRAAKMAASANLTVSAAKVKYIALQPLKSKFARLGQLSNTRKRSEQSQQSQQSQ